MSQDMKTKHILRGNPLEITIVIEKSTSFHNLTFQFTPSPVSINVPPNELILCIEMLQNIILFMCPSYESK